MALYSSLERAKEAVTGERTRLEMRADSLLERMGRWHEVAVAFLVDRACFGVQACTTQSVTAVLNFSSVHRQDESVGAQEV